MHSPQIEPEGRLYWTPDQNLTAVLLAWGFSLIGVERQAHSILAFVFRWNEDLNGAVASYWTDQLTVNARALIRFLDEVQVMTETWARGGDDADGA